MKHLTKRQRKLANGMNAVTQQWFEDGHKTPQYVNINSGHPDKLPHYVKVAKGTPYVNIKNFGG